MATEPLGDPNATITRPGIKNFNIKDVFNSFGYYPTQEEIDAMAGTFQGTYNMGETGTSAVAQYVMQKRAEVERQKNDPLAALQKKMDESVALMKNQVQGLYGQLQDTLKEAPKLFGELTPDQIQTYLAPLQYSFDQQLAQVQGAIASRGISGSSTENNALANTGEQFQQQVLSTGLDVGMKSQQAKAAAIQKQIDNLFGLTGHEESISAAASGQKSAQDLSQSNLIASLPYFLSQDAFAKQEALKASKGGGTPWGTIAGTLLGGGLGAFGGPAGAAIGASVGGSLGSSFDKTGSKNSGGYNPSNALFLASLMNKGKTPSYGADTTNPELFDTLI